MVLESGWQVLSGRQHFQGGMLKFTYTAPSGNRYVNGHPRGSYRTCFGPSFLHHGAILQANNTNLAVGFARRMCAIRAPEKPGLHSWLLGQQHRFFALADTQALLGTLRELYTPMFDTFQGALTEARLHHADPHQKRAARLQAWRDLNTGGGRPQVHLGDRLWLQRIIFKCKTDEWAKPGKPIRGIGDLGTPASLQGCVVTSLLKDAMAAKPLRLERGVIEFCKAPDHSNLTRIFAQLLQPEGDTHFVYFSDDSCFSVRVQSNVYTFNVDIKTCDASHTPAIFKALLQIIPTGLPREAMQVLVEQCDLPVLIRNLDAPPGGKPLREQVLLKAPCTKLFSGSTITTVLNNLANICIGYCLSTQDYSACNNVKDVADIVERAAAIAGYIVTIEPCHDYSDVQFLKHSPVIDTEGRLQPMLNPGVLFRASGICKGDLPGSGSWEDRAAWFQAGLIQGMYPRTDCVFLDLMRAAVDIPRRCPNRTQRSIDLEVAKLTAHKVIDDDRPRFRVTLEEFFRRYRLVAYELEEMRLIATYGTGWAHATTGTDKVLMKDYGLSARLPR